jgi:hypothetical protein
VKQLQQHIHCFKDAWQQQQQPSRTLAVPKLLLLLLLVRSLQSCHRCPRQQQQQRQAQPASPGDHR